MKKLARILAFVLASLVLTGCASLHRQTALPETTQEVPTTAWTMVPTTEPATIPTTQPPTTEPTTLPTTEPTTEPTTVPTTEPVYGGLTVTDWSQSVKPGDTGYAEIQGKPGVCYSITVYYKSGASKAKGLDPQTADDTGTAAWHWKVGSKTSPGTFRITITGGGETQTVSFTVLGK